MPVVLKSPRKYGKTLIRSCLGSGSILDALRISVPIIVVPNPYLLDNHQEELAEELAKLGYVVHGNLKYVSKFQIISAIY